jgi:hypothetical protein
MSVQAIVRNCAAPLGELCPTALPHFKQKNEPAHEDPDEPDRPSPRTPERSWVVSGWRLNAAASHEMAQQATRSRASNPRSLRGGAKRLADDLTYIARLQTYHAQSGIIRGYGLTAG